MSRDLKTEIMKLKKEKNALVLAHYYQPPEIQQCADYVGDSYYLSEVARDSDKDIVVFCGVRFMAESAKILSPNKKILMPSLNAGCSMADMASVQAVKNMKEKYPKACVVCYINSSSEVKAYSDVSVTSSSALNIMKNIDEDEIIFLPDKNLGQYISEFFPEKRFILWDGYCKAHNDIKKEEIVNLKNQYKDARVLVHPECTKEVRELADYVGSTSGIIKYATDSKDITFIVATEEGILYELQSKNPDKKFILASKCIRCSDMKKTTLENLYETLLYMKNEIKLDEDIRKKAFKSLENMHKLS